MFYIDEYYSFSLSLSLSLTRSTMMWKKSFMSLEKLFGSEKMKMKIKMYEKKLLCRFFRSGFVRQKRNSLTKIEIKENSMPSFSKKKVS